METFATPLDSVRLIKPPTIFKDFRDRYVETPVLAIPEVDIVHPVGEQPTLGAGTAQIWQWPCRHERAGDLPLQADVGVRSAKIGHAELE